MGVFLELKWGTRILAIIYVVSGIGGSLLSLLIHPDQISVGASGALYGLMGAWFVEIICTWDKTNELTRFVYFLQVVGYILLGMVISLLVPIIDWAGHLGGLLTGAMLSLYFFAQHLQSERKKNLFPKVAQYILLGFFLIGILCFYLFVTPNTTEWHLRAVGLDKGTVAGINQ